MPTGRQRGVVRGGLWGLILFLASILLTGAAPHGPATGVDGPHREAPDSPASVDLRGIPPGGPWRPTKPFLHPGGQAELDREKGEAERLPPGEGAFADPMAQAYPLPKHPE